MIRFAAWSAPLVGLATLSFVLGCEEKPSASSSSAKRSEAVLAAPGAPSAAPGGAKPEPAVLTKAKRTGPLCDKKPNSDFPTASVSGLGSKSTPFAGGVPARAEVTWVNLWAAWCEPCKKEIPLLIEFQKKLSAESVRMGLSFVSVDEDQRQLQQFLDQQPPTGLRETFWLKEGPERDEWLPKVGLGVDPRLPVHLIVDAAGKVACQIDGSIEPGDYEEIRSLLRSL